MGYVEDKLAHLAATVALEGQRTRDAFAAGLQETKDGLRVTGARYTTLLPNARTVLAAGRLVGWSLYNDAAATGPAVLTLRDGQNVDDDPVAIIAVPAGTSVTVPLPGAGVSFVHGLYAQVTGTGPLLSGVLWIGAVD